MALSPISQPVLRLAGFSLLALCAIACPSSASAESVRVLLAQDLPQLEITTQDDAVIAIVNGHERLFKAPVAVTALGAGISINGIKMPATSLTLRPIRTWLSLTLSKKAVDPAPPTGVNGGSVSKTGMDVSGIVQIFQRGKGLVVINHVDLEEYVKGVVPSEVNAAWHLEMLKTQAVAARTYVLYQRMLSAGRDYDVVASTQDQVYRGRQGIDGQVEQAVETTRGLVVTYQGAPIYAAFSSTAAGPTEDAMNVWAKDLPYLKGVECPFDLNSPHYQWRASFKIEALERNLRQQGFAVGTIATLTPLTYSRAGRVATLRLLHSGGELILRGEDLRKAVGYTIVPSTQFAIESVGAEVVLTGYGAGHAVGLCQWGAKELAELGYSFTTILQYYYPGTELNNASLTKPPVPAVPTS